MKHLLVFLVCILVNGLTSAQNEHINREQETLDLISEHFYKINKLHNSELCMVFYTEFLRSGYSQKKIDELVNDSIELMKMDGVEITEVDKEEIRNMYLQHSEKQKHMIRKTKITRNKKVSRLDRVQVPFSELEALLEGNIEYTDTYVNVESGMSVWLNHRDKTKAYSNSPFDMFGENGYNYVINDYIVRLYKIGALNQPNKSVSNDNLNVDVVKQLFDNVLRLNHIKDLYKIVKLESNNFMVTFKRHQSYDTHFVEMKFDRASSGDLIYEEFFENGMSVLTKKYTNYELFQNTNLRLPYNITIQTLSNDGYVVSKNQDLEFIETGLNMDDVFEMANYEEYQTIGFN